MRCRLPSPSHRKTGSGGRPPALSGGSDPPPRFRSSADLLAQITAEQMLLEDNAVAIVEGDLARLIGIGEPAGFRQRLIAAGKAGSRLALPVLGDGPAPLRRMDSIA